MKLFVMNKLAKIIVFAIAALLVSLNYFSILNPIFYCAQHTIAAIVCNIFLIYIICTIFIKNHCNKNILLDIVTLFLMPIALLVLSFKPISEKIYFIILKANVFLECHYFFSVEENVDMAMFVLGMIFLFLWLIIELPVYFLISKRDSDTRI